MTTVRMMIGLGLCFMIYKEAGVWTCIFAVLMFLYTEMTTIWMKRFKRYVDNKSSNDQEKQTPPKKSKFQERLDEAYKKRNGK